MSSGSTSCWPDDCGYCSWIWIESEGVWWGLFHLCTEDCDCDIPPYYGTEDGEIAYTCCRHPDSPLACEDPPECLWEWWAWGEQWVQLIFCQTDRNCQCLPPAFEGSYDGQLVYSPCVYSG